MTDWRQWIRDLNCEVGIHFMDHSSDEVVAVHGHVRVVERQCSNCDHTGEYEIPPGQWRRRPKALL